MKPEWQIPTEDFFARLNSDAEQFQEQLRLPDIRSIEHIIPLRSLRSVQSVIPMSRELLLHLVRKIHTLHGLKPFGAARIELCRIDPRHLKIGQRFVYRENYQQLLETLPNLLSDYAFSSGASDLGAYFIFGADQNNTPSLACYLPPLIEHLNSDLVIMDGIHRNYLAMQVGATICVVIISDVSEDFPCAPHSWSDIRVIGLSEKPERIEDRYFELNKELFRDLKYLGIDG